MDFSLTEEQQAASDLAGEILADLTTPQHVAALEDPWFDPASWRQLAQAGLLGLAIGEESGGGGLGFMGAHLLLEQIGLHAAPLPLLETIVCGALPIATFGTAAQRDQWLPGVLEGTTLLTAALAEEGGSDPAQPRARAERTAGGWELVGVKTPVPLAVKAAAFLVPARTDDGCTGVWLVPRDAGGVEVRPQDMLAGSAYGELTLNRVELDSGAVLGDLEGGVLTWLLEHAAAGVASLTAGLCAAALRMSADYTSRREQFGRPVATFQAVAQRVADAYIDTEAVQLTSLQAAWRLTEGLVASDEVAIAKWWAAEAGHRVLHTAQHVHGGVGVDRNYPLHRYFAAAKHYEFTLGGGTPHLLKISASLAAEPA